MLNTRERDKCISLFLKVECDEFTLRCVNERAKEREREIKIEIKSQHFKQKGTICRYQIFHKLEHVQSTKLQVLFSVYRPFDNLRSSHSLKNFINAWQNSTYYSSTDIINNMMFTFNSERNYILLIRRGIIYF